MKIENKSFYDKVIAKGLITEQTALKIAPSGGHYGVLMHVINSGAMRRPDACKLWADSLGVAWVDLKETLFQQTSVNLLDKKTALDKMCIPLYEIGGVVTVAMADPANKKIIAELQTKVGKQVSPVFSTEDDITDAVEIQFHTTLELEKLGGKFDPSTIPLKREITRAELEKIAGNEAIIEITRTMLLLAVKEGASDIHIEPAEDNIVVRFRIDGVMNEKLRLASELLPALASRIKVMAAMDITEKRKPQDGRITLDLATRSISFRVSTVPTVNGEKTVLRLLGQIQKRSIPQLEELNLSRQIYDWIQQLIKAPTGAFFITGPTGSGKTTTLFSALSRICTPEINVMTIEDPVEYRLPWANQVQANQSIGLTFASALRAFLRQDPDVILIGEIRDVETAKIATEAALTGHLVLSSLHTNDAIQAVTRLVEIGVEPFLVGPSIIGVMSQRLVRKICDACKESYTLTKEEMDELFEWEGLQPVRMYRGKGCPACRHTGYNGRVAIHEMLMVNEDLRKLVIASAPLNEIRDAAVKVGYKSMRYDGIKKAIRGLTTLSEVNEATYSPY